MVNITESYKSPVRLLQYAGEPINEFSARALTITRKKLLAEMSLSGDELVIDGITYSRNDINNLLAQLAEETWNQHSLIYNVKPLLDFLEKNQFNSDGFASLSQLWSNEQLTAFIAPYFAWSFNEAYGKLLKDEESEQLAYLMRYHHLVKPEFTDLAYQKIRGYLNDLLYKLRNISWEKFVEDESVLYFIFSSNWMRFINGLPGYFDDTRDEIGMAMLNLVYRFQRKATWDYLYEVCNKLKQLKCNSEISKNIGEYTDIMYNNMKKTGGKQSSSGSSDSEGCSGSSWRIIFGVLWIIFMIFKLGRSCNTDRSFDNDRFSLSTVSVEDVTFAQNNKLATDTNRTAFFNAFRELSRQSNKGTPKKVSTGSIPFSRLGKSVPSAEEKNTILIRNNASKDAVLFYYNRDMVMVFPGDKIGAAYIKAGEELEIGLDEYDIPKLRFAFGTNWVKLNNPGIVEMKTFTGGLLPPEEKKETKESGEMQLTEYFSKPVRNQPLLAFSICASSRPEDEFYAGGPKTLMYTPQAVKGINTPANRRAVITFKDNDGNVKSEYSGDFYIYHALK